MTGCTGIMLGKHLSATCTFAAAIICSLAARAEPATPEMFGTIPDVSEVQISPDGQTIAMLRTVGETTSVVFYDIVNLDKKPFGVSLKSGEARDLVWADNEHVLMLASDLARMSTTTGLEEIEFFRWFSVSKSKARPVVLFGNEGNAYLPSSGALVSTLPGRDSQSLFARYTVYGGSYDVFRVNLESSATDRDEAGHNGTRDWIASRSGEVIARIDYDFSRQVRILYVRDREGEMFHAVKEYPEARGDTSVINFYGEADDPSGLIASVRNDAGMWSLVEVSRASGEKTGTIYENPQYDFDDVVYDYAKATAIGVRYIDDMPRTVFFDSSQQKIQEALVRALPNAAPMIVSWSDDQSRLIVKAVYSDHSPQYFLFDRAAKTLTLVAASYLSLDGKTMAIKEKYDYVTDDGLTIHGYLTVPKGGSKKSMPLIVLPHGGPQGRDDRTFDWWSFFYAANGYLVYQPNFRGSDGYGYEFLKAGFGEWGRKMQDDVTFGVKNLIADGIVDPERICIVGGSYGGYAALAGAMLTPDLYACAVSVNGVSDLPAMIGRTARWSEEAEDYWDIRLGSRFRDAAALDEVSPVKIADRAGPPIMIIHGRDDTVVPFAHALRMLDALNAAKKPVEFVELKGEDHWLSRGKTRTEMLSQSITFINKYIGAKASASAQ